MMHGRKTEAYLNATVSDIVRRVAGKANVIPGRIDFTTEIHDHITQADVDDWTFLESLAESCGYDLYVADGQLHFRKPATILGPPPVAGVMPSESPKQIARS